MSNIPSDLKFAKSHEWVRVSPEGIAEIGISDHAQGALGDLVFVEVPESGRKVSVGDACAVVESVKAASDVYAPVSGEVVEGNPALTETPELINQDPYGAGWLMRVRMSNSAELDSLLEAKAYEELLASDSH
jgi:glycine cleavage system H protein